MSIKTFIAETRPEHCEGHCHMEVLKETSGDIDYVNFCSGAGDYWIRIGSLNARFRNCGNGGGRPPETFDTLRSIQGKVFDKTISNDNCLPLHHNFSVARQEDDSWIDVTIALKRDCLSIVLDRPTQGPCSLDDPGREEFTVTLSECPTSLYAAFIETAYAMLRDNGETIGSNGQIIALRPLTERAPSSYWERASRNLDFKFHLDFEG